MPTSDRSTAPVMNGTGQPLLYLEYDGPLHPAAVGWDPVRGQPRLNRHLEHCLFEHAPLLEQVLTPYPEVAIVLTTQWVLHYGLRKAAKELPSGLRSRVVGSIYDDQPSSFLTLSKGLQVVLDVEKRAPKRWVAVDATRAGWPEWAKPHVLLVGARSGIGSAAASARLLKGLRELAS